MAFGDFTGLCMQSNVPLCALIGDYIEGTLVPIDGQCIPRTVMLANTMVFNIGNVFLQLGMFIVISIVGYNALLKYTAVGRREMIDLNYIFFLLTVFSLVVDANVSSPESGTYPYFVAVQSGLASALCAQLVFIGLTMFQFWEDGRFKAIFMGRCGVAIWGIANFLVCMLTFKNWAHSTVIGPNETAFLMAFLYVVNAVLVFFYLISSLWLTGMVLIEWWAFGALIFGTAFFVCGQLLLYQFSNLICIHTQHYVDGKFFATVCNMFAYVMIYKAWDIITTEDLEFSVSPSDNVWDLKSADEGLSESEYAMSHYTLQSGMI